MNYTSQNIFTLFGKKPRSSVFWTAYPFSSKNELLVTTLSAIFVVCFADVACTTSQRHYFPKLAILFGNLFCVSPSYWRDE